MKADRNRPWRKACSNEARRVLAAIAAVGALALFSTPADAITGGASPYPTAAETPESAGLAFSSVRSAGATWYGPGLYGNNTACGQTLLPETIGVAHRTLPCGTAVKFLHRGRSLVARVIDRGPFVSGVDWDLTNGARRLLGFEGIGQIRYAIAVKPAAARLASRR
jgi:rare lipoprotein A